MYLRKWLQIKATSCVLNITDIVLTIIVVFYTEV